MATILVKTMSHSFVCSCFYTNNYFVSSLNTHVIFKGAKQFLEEYKGYFKEKRLTSKDIEKVVKQLETEYDRRCNLGKQSIERTNTIKEKYIPLFPHVYILQPSYLEQSFLDIVSYCKEEGATFDGVLPKLDVQRATRVYSFPIFTTEFCADLQSEILNFERSDLPKGRPNTMNNYGVLLDEMGFDENLLTPLREDYLEPLTRLLYSDWGGASLDSHKAFIVSYSEDGDQDLAYHYDNAEITINIALSSDFEGGALYFGDMRTVPREETRFYEYKHRLGHGLIHRGQHNHGSMAVLDGERHNLIMWMRSSAVRNENCPMCDKTPQLVETVGPGDGFTQSLANLCSLA